MHKRLTSHSLFPASIGDPLTACYTALRSWNETHKLRKASKCAGIRSELDERLLYDIGIQDTRPAHPMPVWSNNPYAVLIESLTRFDSRR